MRNTRCPFCGKIYNDKHKFCNHIAMQHNEQIPEDQQPLEFAYSLLVHKPTGRVCVICRKNPVRFNNETLKYDRLCDNPACKDEYVRIMKARMVKVHGQEHLLNDADMQRKMIYNHHNAKDFIWDDEHKFRIIGTYEEDFLRKLKSIGWSPNDIIAPSPNNYWYKWKDGTTHLYIPDFYIPSLSLEVEIKESDNQHPRMEHEREMEALKDKRLAAEEKTTNIHYIKIVDKKYDEFMRDYVKSDENKPD
jgi:hypothetical protein